MVFKSINPFNGTVAGEYHAISDAVLSQKLDNSAAAFENWKMVTLEDRIRFIRRVGDLLIENKEQYARMITLEMGKPIAEARAEVAKCKLVCDYYAENASGFLADEIIHTDASKSFVRHDPIGTVFAIMPWNFPFWQVFRFAIPTLTAGNTGLLKHAPNVFGCAVMIQEVFDKAGIPENVFQNLIVHHDKTETIIAHDAVKAVTLTGSEKAGAAVAEIAGRYIKKSLLELGGNNSFIVWADADIDKAVRTALTARMLNCGQSCIAAKRFILVDEIYEEFVSRFTAAVTDLRSGDPMEDQTQVGPLARIDLADQLHDQVQKSISEGAELLSGGAQDNCYHQPTILGNVTSEMTAFREETFGPLAAMIRAKDESDAFRLANMSRYGLGTTVCTSNTQKALNMAGQVADGAYFVNELVKSDPRLPFGGTKNSGYGRELAKDGMMEFINRKTVFLK